MADTLDVLTFDEAKEAVGKGAGDSTEATVLARYVTAVSRLLDDRIGPTVRRTITGEEHHRIAGMSTVVLRHRPVTAVTSITEYQDTTGTALTVMSLTSQPNEGYRLVPYDPTPGLYSGIVERTSGDRCTYFRGPVSVTYTAGRVQSTTQVDARIKHAAVICLENLWRDRQQSAGQFGEFDVPVVSFPTFAMPKAAADLLIEEIGQNEPWGIA